MATTKKAMKRRDNYKSRLYPDTTVPVGVGAASMDLGNALSLIRDWIERQEWQSAPVKVSNDWSAPSWPLIEVIMVALEAWRQSINPALLVYDRLQRNAEQAETILVASAIAESDDTRLWAAISGSLRKALAGKPLASQASISLARKLLQEAAKEDPDLASRAIQALIEQEERNDARE